MKSTNRPDPATEFQQRNHHMIGKMAADKALSSCARQVFDAANRYEYSYHFTWMGRPIIQYPQDMLALQEIIWSVKPDLIIETGVAHGGSLVYSASLLELIGGKGRVIGIDIDIRPHNLEAIRSHPMAGRIELIEGSSTDSEVVTRVSGLAEHAHTVMVLLDSNHTHDHVLSELRIYSRFVTTGSYLVVFDTCIEDMPDEAVKDRPWGKGNNPKTAVHQFLGENRAFVIDEAIQKKLLLTVAPDGYLRCVQGQRTPHP